MSAIAELKQLLENDIHQLRQLIALMNEESRVLRNRDVKALEPLAARKGKLLDDVRTRAREKVHLLVKIGYRPDQGEPSRFIRSAGLTELTSLWSEAQKLLTQCQGINSQNSRTVSHLQKRLARLTDIFRGSSNQQKLYGASGEQTSVGQRNILASA